LTALNSDLSLRWQVRPSDVAYGNLIYTPAVAADGTIYFTARFSLYAYDPYGAQKWEFSTRENITSAPTVGSDGTVYFSTDANLYAVKGSAPLAATSWPVEGGNPRRSFRATVPPAFTSVPLSTNAVFGDSASFTAAASGTPPLNYQWSFDGTVLSDATNSTLTLSQVTMTNAGTYSVQAMNPATGLLVITNTMLTVTPANPMINWSALGNIVFGTPLGSNQLSATANTAGTFTYQPATGFLLPAGTNVLTAAFTPTDSLDYITVEVTNTLVIEQQTPVITWNPLQNLTYPASLGSTQLSATANVTGGFNYQPANGSILPAGTNVLTGTFVPADLIDYTSITASNSLVVTPGTPIIGWPPLEPLSYGAELGTNQLSATANVPGEFTYLPALGAILPVGTNLLVATFVPADTNDYILASATNSLLVVFSPTLSITDSDGELVIAWSDSTQQFELETSPSLGSNANWVPVTGAINIGNGSYVYVSTPGATAAFFRLQQR
jgi:hypothetical protein